MKIKYTLPKWVDRSAAPTEMKESWDKYLAALTRHERGDKDIAVQAANRIELAVAAMCKWGDSAFCFPDRKSRGQVENMLTEIECGVPGIHKN